MFVDLYIFLYTTDLHNTKIKSKLNTPSTETYLMYCYQVGETKKVNKKGPYMYVYINIVNNLFYRNLTLDKKK